MLETLCIAASGKAVSTMGKYPSMFSITIGSLIFSHFQAANKKKPQSSVTYRNMDIVNQLFASVFLIFAELVI